MKIFIKLIRFSLVFFADDIKVCNRVDTPGVIRNMEDDLASVENW